ncbi:MULTISPECIES: hypothetical protein [Acidianus]|uniref:Uncharacterized protein n=1 Tax=Candidatus Acidianus copahuensis TaxID=1160895 RepID=A0A031LNR3_9CREN|nr:MULTISPECIES: hypothetical protein [Acidianus]EZQ04769.1 hypothetical protein CM19_08595 [Candidatus Acidianus copahuensis]NON62267.1 hypothetical protein [Acidianus sp. RZ1]
MPTIKVIFGPEGDNGITFLLFEVVKTLPNKQSISIDVETDLLYQYNSPTIEINGKRTVIDYFSDEECKEKLHRLIKGELIEERKTKKIYKTNDYIFGEGVPAF